jgi:hypothetical protein
LTDSFTIDTPDALSGLPRSGSFDTRARIFRLGGQWYFASREGDIGPFLTREQARHEATVHQSVRASHQD